MTRKILLILGHPETKADTYCRALADAYETGARAAGHEVARFNLADMEFVPVRRHRFDEEEAPEPAIAEAEEALKGADHMVFVHPLWFGMMPALMHGFIERVFTEGVAVRTNKAKRMGYEKLLTGKSARIITTMGMPAIAYRWYFGAHAYKALKRNILAFCGVGPVRATFIGMVDVEAYAGRREKWLARIEELGRRGI